MKLLEINHCRKSFGAVEVLTDINLFVEEGHVVSIIGPSGSGKSTLLRCATLLETMDGGDLIYSGQYAAREPKWQIRLCQPFGAEADPRHVRPGVSKFQPFPALFHSLSQSNITEAPILVQKREKEEVYAAAQELLKQMGFPTRRTPILTSSRAVSSSAFPSRARWRFGPKFYFLTNLPPRWTRS